MLCGRNYTEKAEVVFKEIVEQRALELLPDEWSQTGRLS